MDPWVLRIARVVDHVQVHLDEDLKPEELAAVAGFSLHHFHRVFRGITGESVMAFVRRLRLERAAQRLRYDPAPVTAVALESGYGSHEAFTRAFRARFGMSPSDYRGEGRRSAETHGMLVREEADRHTVGLRHVGPYETCEEAWAKLEAWAGPRGLLEHQLSSVGLVYDDPDVTAPEHLRYDACLVLPVDTIVSLRPLPAGMVERVVPGGSYAVARHEGAFDSILDTYVALLGRWLPQRGVELSDEPVLEVYLRDPVNHPPEEQLTEVCVRLAPSPGKTMTPGEEP